MKKRRRRRKKKKRQIHITPKTIYIFTAGICLFLLLSLISYDPDDIGYYKSPPNSPVHNLMGSVGAYTGFILFYLYGFGAYVFPIFILLYLISSLKFSPPGKWNILLMAFFTLSVGSSIILYIIQHYYQSSYIPALKLSTAGGIIGGFTGKKLEGYIGRWGTLLFSCLICLISILYITGYKIWQWMLHLLYNALYIVVRAMSQSIRGILQVLMSGINQMYRYMRYLFLFTLNRLSSVLKGKKESKREILKPEGLPALRLAKEPQSENKILSKERDKKPVIKKPAPQKKVVIPEPKPVTASSRSVESLDYQLPSLDLLDEPENEQVIREEDLNKNARILKDTLQEFGISVEVTSIQPGPVVTLYELVPGRGTKIGKISALADDIALAMRSSRVRVIAPIPGKGTVGIEVPNRKPQFVYLKEVIGSSEFLGTDAKIPLALGKDVAGNILIADLTEMPHLLIAGTTGSGKTVCLNAIILSILFKFRPDEVKLIIIDPKMVELSHYKDIPHLVMPVIHNPKKAVLGLNWAVKEMEKRYELLAKVGVRNITGYNNSKSKPPDSPLFYKDIDLMERDYLANPPPRLPYIVIVIDELADLMMVSSSEIETSIARLAQLSRAVGIHIILATQRPSVDVLTGVIKANFSTRISFQVATRIDSRTVLDTSGADMLLGKGDMLFMPPGSSKLIRAQGTFVRDREVRNVVEFITSHKKADFSREKARQDEIFNRLKKEKETTDPLLQEAIDVILTNKQASVSLLQRKLRIGYNRAARLMDILEEQGMVSPPQDGKREILIDTQEHSNA